MVEEREKSEEQGAGGRWQAERKGKRITQRKRKMLGNVPGRGYTRRRIETHEAENQFDIGVDPSIHAM